MLRLRDLLLKIKFLLSIGNQLLLQHKDDFWWFPHTYNHINCVKRKSVDEVMDNLKKNKEFAEVPVYIRIFTCAQHQVPIN